MACKNLIYTYFINDRYSNIEKQISDYDHIGSFIDDFGTSKALRARVYDPKTEEERQKVDEMYEFALKYEEEQNNMPFSIMEAFRETWWDYIVHPYQYSLWILKGIKERIFRL